MLITIVAGARPNFVKIAPIIHAIDKSKKYKNNFDYRLVHTGQHYDKLMSHSFFEQLCIPEPNINLECGGGSQAEQTAAIMVAFEKELMEYPADVVLVVGDVTSTLACSIVAKKLKSKVAHVEAGIRSFDLSMPEEINRMVTDSITDYFFTTSETANSNLRNIGVSSDKIYFVGNVMIDTLYANMPFIKKPLLLDHLGIREKQYIVLTLHRPDNVDDPFKLINYLIAITENVNNLPVIFPVHPRTNNILDKLIDIPENLYTIDPQGYHEFIYLVKNSLAVVTDSGGITEEATVMGVPCITLRDNTERPETVTIGTNELIGANISRIKPTFDTLFNGKWKNGAIPDKWDGKASERIVDILTQLP